ncbi:MAG: hypothetical protein QW356_05920 [Candidatus Hadarchaeales archaeon]
MDMCEGKGRAFEEAIKRCSEQRGILPPPELSITGKPCPLSPGGRAHVHVKRVICVWKGRLEAMTPEEMEEEAALALARPQEDGKAQPTCRRFLPVDV